MATVGAAAITATGAIIVAAIEASDDDPPPPPTPLKGKCRWRRSYQRRSFVTGGGSVSVGGELSIGEAALPAPVRSYVDRKIALIASEKALPNGGRVVGAKVNYAFDGDVKKADPKVGVFNLSDVITFRFDIANVQKAEDARLDIRVDKLVLSTEDVPQTKGHSQLRFARQDGREMWNFVTRVDQGTTPTLRSGPPELKTAEVRLEKDRLTIENLCCRSRTPRPAPRPRPRSRWTSSTKARAPVPSRRWPNFTSQDENETRNLCAPHTATAPARLPPRSRGGGGGLTAPSASVAGHVYAFAPAVRK